MCAYVCVCVLVCVCVCACVASDLGVKCDMYHAGMSNDRRTRVHYRFLRDELQVKPAHIVHVVALFVYVPAPNRIKLSHCQEGGWHCQNVWDTLV